MKSSLFQDILKPFIVLVVICLVTSALLGVTNEMTKDVIAENERAAAEATRKAVLPGATTFTEIPADPSWGVDGVYKEDSGLGYVITAHHKGYGGDVVVTVGFDNNGSITQVSADTSTETQGVGSKAGKEDYLAQYAGVSGKAENVELITSATFSSTAVRESVNKALGAFALAAGEAK